MSSIEIPTIFLKIPSDVSVCVPMDINEATTYVLLEQEDWFEEEMTFVRRLIRPGMHILDIGANHGVYALTMTKLAGSNGHVWAIEPSSVTAGRLKQSILENGFENNLTVIQAALSDHSGTAKLGLSSTSDLNSLQDGEATGEFEVVPLKTLDEISGSFVQDPVDFIKLDAEGEEVNVLSGGQEFFKKNSPLIMFELKHGSEFNYDLMDTFKNLGMNLYHYIPCLEALVPVVDVKKLDGYTLNLFACRPDAANILVQRNLLLLSRETSTEIRRQTEDLIEETDWKAILAEKPFWVRIANWSFDTDNCATYIRALKGMLVAESKAISLPIRWRAANQSKRDFEEAMENGDRHPLTVVSYIRILNGLGHRLAATDLMGRNMDVILKISDESLIRPWLPPQKQEDERMIQKSVSDWLKAVCTQFVERKRAFSSRYASQSQNYKELLDNPEHHIEMERRVVLQSLLFGKRVKLRPESKLLKDGNPDHRNSHAWKMLQLFSRPNDSSTAKSQRTSSMQTMGTWLNDFGILEILDVGAASHGEGSEPYHCLVEQGIARITGFEPDEEECEKVRTFHDSSHRYFPYFIGTGKAGTYYETNFGQTGSLYAPNREMLDTFTQLGDFVQLVKTHEVQTHRLDDIPEIKDVDLLKMDIQGSELDVLKNASVVTDNALVLHVEVEFLELYQNQPLFSDVDSFLRGKGFFLYTLIGPMGRARSPFIRRDLNWNPGAASQLLWSDALYVRDFRTFNLLSSNKLKRLAVILHDCYKAYDLCHQALADLDVKESSHYSSAYKEWVVSNGLLEVTE